LEDNGPFLKEEGELIRAVSQRLGKIVQQKRTEEENQKLALQLQQAQRLGAVGQLAAGVAHDFNNILATLVGNLELFKDDLGPNHSNHQGLFDEILSAIARAQKLVNSMLFSGRKVHWEKQKVSLKALLEEEIENLRSDFPQNVDLILNLSDGPSLVFANPEQVRLLIANLCKNAFEAMMEGEGCLTIKMESVPTLKQKSTSSQDMIRLSISDTGPGIEEENQNKLFEPFFTTKQEASGLGLSVVYEAVRELGGTIEVHSELGNGAEFEVVLPLASQDNSCSSGINSQQEDSFNGEERLLLVDDDVSVLRIINKHLLLLGYNVTIKNSAHEALETLLPSPDGYDLIITDLTMPEMTGLELAKKVLEINPQMKMILTTGYGENESISQWHKLGFKHILPKPITMNYLSKTIRATLDNNEIR